MTAAPWFNSLPYPPGPSRRWVHAPRAAHRVPLAPHLVVLSDTPKATQLVTAVADANTHSRSGAHQEAAAAYRWAARHAGDQPDNASDQATRIRPDLRPVIPPSGPPGSGGSARRLD